MKARLAHVGAADDRKCSSHSFLSFPFLLFRIFEMVLSTIKAAAVR